MLRRVPHHGATDISVEEFSGALAGIFPDFLLGPEGAFERRPGRRVDNAVDVVTGTVARTNGRRFARTTQQKASRCKGHRVP
jgi:hypothetical protein